MEQPLHCFTLKFIGRALVLHTPISVGAPSLSVSTQQKFTTRCIWDTGASGTVITQNVVNALGLKPTGFKEVNTASERNKLTQTYEIDLYLSDALIFRTISVTLGVITDGIDCLLGMDVIGTGDLSVTNYNGNTCMSFRYPSSHEIDFTTNQKFGIKPEKQIPPGQLGSNKTLPKKKRRKR